MNRIIKRNLSVLLVFVMAFSINIVALAQGTTSLTVSSSQIAVGQTTTVSVNASATGTVEVKYTASLLEISNCTASGYSNDGNTITFNGTSGDIEFKAIAEGTASVIVSSSSCSGSSTTVTVEGYAEEGATTEAAPVEAVAASAEYGTINESGGFDIAGVAYVVSERYSDAEIPAGFSKVTLTIGSGTYSELTNNSVTIIYLKPADNTAGSGVFYLYDAEAGTVAPFEMVGSASNYVILGATDSVPSSLYETELTTDNGSYTAYTFDGSEFYYIYGTNAGGVTGWFMYDTATGAVGRADMAAFSIVAVTAPTESTSESADSAYDVAKVYKDKISKLRKIISVLVVAWVILLFVGINLIIRRRTTEAEDGDDIFANSPAPRTAKHPRSIVFDDPDGDDDEDDDEDEDDDFSGSADSSINKRQEDNSGIDLMDLNDL